MERQSYLWIYKSDNLPQMNPETRNTSMIKYEGKFSHYHVSEELYFHEMVLAETLAHTFGVSVLSHYCLHCADPTLEWKRTVAPLHLVQGSINHRENVKEHLTWCLLLGGPVDAIARKRPPREYSCPNSWLLSTEPSMLMSGSHVSLLLQASKLLSQDFLHLCWCEPWRIRQWGTSEELLFSLCLPKPLTIEGKLSGETYIPREKENGRKPCGPSALPP